MPKNKNEVGQILKKYDAALWIYGIFTLIGCIVWAIRDWRYFCLFNGIGTCELVARIIVANRPATRQLMRRISQGIVAAILLVMLGFVFGVNFQFEQIFFDMQAGVVTGALIQLIVARIVIPIPLGNAFCSRACWDGAIFELINNKKCERPVKRKPWLAWSYLILLITMTIIVTHTMTNPAGDENELLRKKWIVGSNVFIIVLGYILTRKLGSRGYCRMLCPFLTISSLFYRISILKITPRQSSECTRCGACNKACPMLIDVRESVARREKISNRQCLLCERCVSACKKNVLQVSHKPAQ